nr:glycosyltransferase family 39 protein [Ardenticatena sp.]
MTTRTVSVDPQTPYRLAFSAEQLAWGLVLAGAALLRLGGLGRWPLAASEAAVVLDVVGPFAHRPPAFAPDAAPLLLNLVGASVWLFGTSEAAVRITTALAGMALVVVLWQMRALLGRSAALGGALLVLASPSLAFFSRQADGTMLALVASLWLVLAGWRFWHTPSRRTLDAMAIVAGVASTAGAGVWVLAVAALIWLAWMRPAVPHAVRALVTTHWMRAVGLALGTAVLLATAFFTNLDGLGEMLAQPAQFVRLWLGMDTAALVVPYMAAFMLYEWPLVLWGMLGSTILMSQRPRLAAFLLAWSGGALLMPAFLNSGWTGSMALAALPLALLGGVAVAYLFDALMSFAARRDVVALTGGLLILLAFSWLLLLAYAHGRATMSTVILLVGVPVLGGALLVVVGTLLSFGVAWRSAGMLVLLFSLFWQWHTAWQLVYASAPDPREPLVQQAAHPDLLYLADFLPRISLERTLHAERAPLGIQRSLGVLPFWYAREFVQVDALTAPPPSAGKWQIVLLDEVARPPAGMVGQRVYLGRVWAWPGLRGAALVKWLVFREAPGVVSWGGVLYVQVGE